MSDLDGACVLDASDAGLASLYGSECLFYLHWNRSKWGNPEVAYEKARLAAHYGLRALRRLELLEFLRCHTSDPATAREVAEQLLLEVLGDPEVAEAWSDIEAEWW